MLLRLVLSKVSLLIKNPVPITYAEGIIDFWILKIKIKKNKFVNLDLNLITFPQAICLEFLASLKSLPQSGWLISL